MTTITTKQLREDMPRVVRTLQSGRPITLTYRRQVIGTIQPSDPKAEPLRKGSAAAVLNFLETADFKVAEAVRNDPRSIKEQIAEMRGRDI